MKTKYTYEKFFVICRLEKIIAISDGQLTIIFDTQEIIPSTEVKPGEKVRDKMLEAFYKKIEYKNQCIINNLNMEKYYP